MATKLTFWDDHNVDYPIHALFCDGDGEHKAKYIKAIYQLDDSALPDSNEFDLGIFQVGYGDNTLNNKDADPEENLYASQSKWFVRYEIPNGSKVLEEG